MGKGNKTMKWEKVGRMPLDVKGRLVKWAEKRDLGLARIDGEYKFFEKESLDVSQCLLRWCSSCRHAQVLFAYFSEYKCENCDELGKVE